MGSPCGNGTTVGHVAAQNRPHLVSGVYDSTLCRLSSKVSKMSEINHPEPMPGDTTLMVIRLVK